MCVCVCVCVFVCVCVSCVGTTTGKHQHYHAIHTTSYFLFVALQLLGLPGAGLVLTALMLLVTDAYIQVILNLTGPYPPYIYIVWA